MPPPALLDRASGQPLPLRSVRIHSEVDDAIATHTITQDFWNPRDVPLEVVYHFPVHERAVVAGLEVRGARAAFGIERRVSLELAAENPRMMGARGRNEGARNGAGSSRATSASTSTRRSASATRCSSAS